LDQSNEDVNPKDEFNDILTSQFGLENMDTGLPSMDSKDVEDVFNGVLIDESSDNLFPQVNSVPTSADGKIPPETSVAKLLNVKLKGQNLTCFFFIM